MRRRSTLLAAAVAAALLVLLACTTDDAPLPTPTAAPPGTPQPTTTAPREEPDATVASEQAPETPPAFTLQLRHASDMDGAVGAVGALNNVEAFSALFDGFPAEFPGRTIVLSSGDNYVRGPRFFAAADAANDPLPGVSGNGRRDIALLNAMGFQASAIGNHELDLGTGSFASIIAPDVAEGGTYPAAAFPSLSANLRLADDEALRPLIVADGQAGVLAAGSLAGSAVISAGGERIGAVGATTPHLARITSVGGIDRTPFARPPLMRVQRVAEPPSARRRQPGQCRARYQAAPREPSAARLRTLNRNEANVAVEGLPDGEMDRAGHRPAPAGGCGAHGL